MEWAALGLAVAALGAFGVALRYAVSAGNARVELAKKDGELLRAITDANDAKRKYWAESAGHEETRVRLEHVVSLRDARIHEVESQLDEVLKDIDPGLLGSSLRDLSILQRSKPADGTVAAARPEAAASLPASVTAAVGAVTGRPGRGGAL